jgi:uroporphyrinogen III methyltransferase/synthase
MALDFYSNSSIKPESTDTGWVYLIGAGPGDPGLITVKGLEILRRADAIVYDYLVNPVLLEEVKPGAQLFYMGKKAGQPSASQSEINHHLVQLAQEGKIVARLKGGDPFVFGRGGEEAEALVAAGIKYEVVPGISSAIAVPAYAGIPITHRTYSSTFTVITGHEEANRPMDDSHVNWHALAQIGGTLVFLMGLGRLPDIATRLVEAGLSAQTPAAAIEWGTTERQRNVTGTLQDLPELVKNAEIKSPAVIVIGQVVSLSERLQWFDHALLVAGQLQ